MAIVVGDIHGDIEKARAFLAYMPDQEHVALGDYLDSFSVPFLQQVECLNLLLDSEAVLLLGNHECHYLRKPLFHFAGYQLDHAAELQDIMEYNLYRFKAAYVADGWLCTHAGVNSKITEHQSDVTVLADMFNNSWELYLNHRLVDHIARYLYQSIFHFNHCIFVEGNLLPTNISQIFGHMEHTRPILEPNYIALDTTNHNNSCWLFDTAKYELVQLPLEPKIGRVRFQGGGWS
jgi:Calcineurin-like phosphoesterase